MNIYEISDIENLEMQQKLIYTMYKWGGICSPNPDLSCPNLIFEEFN